MQRLTARLLIVFVLVGILAPGALALAGSPLGSCCTQGTHSHACCMRKGRSGPSQQPEISAQMCGSHCACNGVVTGHWAGLNGLAQAQIAPVAASFVFPASSAGTSLQFSGTHSGRAPPAISLA